MGSKHLRGPRKWIVLFARPMCPCRSAPWGLKQAFRDRNSKINLRSLCPVGCQRQVRYGPSSAYVRQGRCRRQFAWLFGAGQGCIHSWTNLQGKFRSVGRWDCAPTRRVSKVRGRCNLHSDKNWPTASNAIRPAEAARVAQLRLLDAWFRGMAQNPPAHYKSTGKDWERSDPVAAEEDFPW